jgi:mycothiol synthase
MASSEAETEELHPDGAPDMPGLAFRRFRGAADFPGMLAAILRSAEVDKLERADTLEQLARNYSSLRNSDARRDMMIVEGEGEIVGYNRVEWWADNDGTLIYNHLGFLVPEWRNRGIGRAMILHAEKRLREIAAAHDPATPKLFDTEAADTQVGCINLLTELGYAPVRYFCAMVRPNLDDVPDLALPDAVETRPVEPEHLRAIWEAEVEALKDHWGIMEQQEGDFDLWLNDKWFQPHLWQVAWDGDQVVGMVRNYVDEAQNEKFSRKRGYTEYISVRRPWRGRGVAKALIARSFTVLKAQGMKEAALGVDTDNPSGALQLYKGMGFHETGRDANYRKPLT